MYCINYKRMLKYNRCVLYDIYEFKTKGEKVKVKVKVKWVLFLEEAIEIYNSEVKEFLEKYNKQKEIKDELQTKITNLENVIEKLKNTPVRDYQDNEEKTEEINARHKELEVLKAEKTNIKPVEIQISEKHKILQNRLENRKQKLENNIEIKNRIDITQNQIDEINTQIIELEKIKTKTDDNFERINIIIKINSRKKEIVLAKKELKDIEQNFEPIEDAETELEKVDKVLSILKTPINENSKIINKDPKVNETKIDEAEENKVEDIFINEFRYDGDENLEDFDEIQIPEESNKLKFYNIITEDIETEPQPKKQYKILFNAKERFYQIQDDQNMVTYSLDAIKNNQEFKEFDKFIKNDNVDKFAAYCLYKFDSTNTALCDYLNCIMEYTGKEINIQNNFDIRYNLKGLYNPLKYNKIQRMKIISLVKKQEDLGIGIAIKRPIIRQTIEKIMMRFKRKIGQKLLNSVKEEEKYLENKVNKKDNDFVDKLSPELQELVARIRKAKSLEELKQIGYENGKLITSVSGKEDEMLAKIVEEVKEKLGKEPNNEKINNKELENEEYN